MLLIEAEVNPFVCMFELRRQEPLPFERVDGAVIPRENVNVQVRVSLAQVLQEREKVNVAAVFACLLATNETHMAVELPAGDHQIVTCLTGGFVESAVVGSAVHEQ